MQKLSVRPLCLLLMGLAAAARVMAQDAPPPPPRPAINLPPVVRSVRASHTGPGMIVAQQPSFPAEIVLSNHGDKDWLEFTQVTSRTRAEIVSARLGWAYALPAGLEFHQGEVITPPSGVAAGASFQVTEQGVAPRADAKDFVAFMEQVTLADGTVANADHAKITAFYTACCTGPNAGKVALPPTIPRAQQDVPGGAAGTGVAQTPDLKPIEFAVVSFRRTERMGPSRVDLPAEGDFIAYHGVPMERLILFAHIAKKGYVSIVDEPDWAKTELYEFEAKVAPEDIAQWKAMTLTDKRAMVGRMLETELKLKVHQETEPQPVYELVVAKGGPKLMDYEPGDTVTPNGGHPLTGKVLSWFDPFNLTCQDTTMAELVNSLSGPQRAGRVVVDKTGLTGVYDFTVPIPYQPLPEQFQQMAEDSGVPSFLVGLKQLGLALQPGKGVVDQIVVDHVERPETN